MKRQVVIILVCIGFPLLSLGQSNVGTTSAAFLEIGVGARAVAMGEAYTSVANDVTALYWNPGGITKAEKSEVSFQYTDWIIDTKLNYVAGIFRSGSQYFGIQFYMFDGGRMEVTDLLFPEGTGESFGVQDMSLGLTYGRKLTNNFGMGGTLKYIQSRIWRMTAQTIALDLGFTYQTPVKNLNLGFSISNFGSEMQLDGDNTSVRIDLDPTSSGTNDGLLGKLDVGRWDLPLLFRIGLNYKVMDNILHRIIIATDAVYPNNNNNYVNAGIEYGFRNMFFLRGGYANAFLPDNSGLGHLRAGFGVYVNNQFSIDYAYSDRGVLGSVNTVGASIRF